MGTLSKETGAVAGISQRQGRYKRSAPAFLIILAALVLLLGFSMVLSVCTGIAGGSFKVFAETVIYPAKASDVGMIMLEMRMPRALAAGLTGMAFALSGAVMQGITRNPLSDAGLLGINAGAGFFVALSAILFPAASDIVKTCAAFAGRQSRGDSKKCHRPALLFRKGNFHDRPDSLSRIYPAQVQRLLQDCYPLCRLGQDFEA